MFSDGVGTVSDELGDLIWKLSATLDEMAVLMQ
jgi:hypothetical protein